MYVRACYDYNILNKLCGKQIKLKIYLNTSNEIIQIRSIGLILVMGFKDI